MGLGNPNKGIGTLSEVPRVPSVGSITLRCVTSMQMTYKVGSQS